ncbi:MAG: repressor LexA [Actinobacteria bacterium RBG_19FT_COMBO_54_7]|uniref:LexA repressor n=1 Tax=Candidatus Solincola sediminis TaxID=1797199 RepID=A0A1F2WHI9_9ACTN|nr:MAG: repressor LexA [Candidatus Solincola sediminis]OFW58771.1 MAG: repressor LexA [Candidatus Solincola sediminis]OFW69857.1 MAG: repressor LexA [Actinobacteria bacterium RBG_19FT_COMBO_54_7]
MEGLTPRQEEVFDFILNNLEERGYPPSIREICEEFNFSSTRGALRHLEALEKKGFISRGSGARAIQVLGSPGSASYIPLVGEVPAGPLRYASEEVEEWIPVPRRLQGEGRFLLRVRGDSMIGDAINDGDLVIVDPRLGVEEGEVVVALVDGEATVKRLRRRKGAIELEASNPAYSPLKIAEGEAEVRLAGKVVALLRDRL